MSDPFYIDPDDALLDLQQALARVHPDLGDVERPSPTSVDHDLLARDVGGPSPS